MKNRLFIFYFLFFIFYFIIIGRLFQLQIIQGKQNRERAEENRIKKIISPAPRGIIFDRNNKPLVNNIPVYRYQDKTITRQEALKLETEGKEKEIMTLIGREYLYGSTLAHVLGYLGETSSEGLQGRTGVEQQYENILKGQNGGELVEVNALGEKIRQIGIIPAKPGENVKLSIDGDLSQIANDALEGKKGAVVVSETKTGQIIVLVSSPSFDPNKILPQVINDPDKPMFNRAIGGLYPPGSTFKIVTATAGLEEDKINNQTIYQDTGEIRVGEYSYKNWYFTQYGKTEGSINLVRAITRSTDTFFYKVGEWVGAKHLTEWAKAFGLGNLTGIDLPGEIKGLVPDPEKGEWYLGNTYHLAIGQGSLLTTPLQINLMTSVVANNGSLCRPSIVERKADCRNLKLKKETLELIKEGMVGVCSRGGTAFPFFDFNPSVACKTGTAEYGDPQKRTHAWLTAFAPVDNPEIVVTVLVEAGGEGSYVAAPIAKKIMDAWFNK